MRRDSPALYDDMLKAVREARKHATLKGVLWHQGESNASRANEYPEKLKTLIEMHLEYTGSTVAKNVLDNWDHTLGQFVKVMPTDYKRVLEAQADEVSAG